jgi:hypothetical protein
MVINPLEFRHSVDHESVHWESAQSGPVSLVLSLGGENNGGTQMKRQLSALAAAGLAAGLALSANTASAGPLAGATGLQSAVPSTIETVQWRGGGWRGGPGWRGGYGPGWRGGWRGPGWGWGAVGAGVVAGAVVGAAIAGPPVVYAVPPPVVYAPPPGYYGPPPAYGPGYGGPPVALPPK